MSLPRSLVYLALLFSMATLALGRPGAPQNSLDPVRGYVFSGASAKLLIQAAMIYREDLKAPWDPGSDEVTRMERVLAQELNHQLRARKATGRPRPFVRDYYRQYAGVRLKGKKLIFINGFHRSEVEETTRLLAQPDHGSELERYPAGARGKDYWHFVPVEVDDGGDHFFQAFYDPAQGRIVVLLFHGPY
jgi:hypothetical protein